MINRSRIQKTKLFFEDREFFMKWLIFEIRAGITKAKKMGFRFSVRLNNTSDISPERFILDGKNILEIFPDVQFYDYTKVPSRKKLLQKYPNYDMTFSYSGYNMADCMEMLKNKIRVAMVFKKIIPTEYLGHKVINGDAYDMRHRDDTAAIVGLKYKRVRAKLTNDIKFVIQ